MMAIVVTHHVFGVDLIYGGGGESMPFFFILSGFVLSLANRNSPKKLSVTEEFLFLKKRLSKIYPLYIFVLIICFVWYSSLAIVGKANESILDYTKYLVIDSVLVQSWIPHTKFYLSLNEVSWFVSSLVFCYLMFLPISRLKEKVFSKQSKYRTMGLLIIVLSLIAFYQIIANCVFHLKEYYSYHFPAYRLLEFVAGMLLADIYKNFKNIEFHKSSIIFSVVEILIILYFPLEQIVLKHFAFQNKYIGPIAIVQVLIMCALILVFSAEKGIVSQIIGNSFFVKVADISMEIFLIHMAVLNIAGALLNQIGLAKYNSLVTIIVTLLAAISWKFINKKWCQRKMASTQTKKVTQGENE